MRKASSRRASRLEERIKQELSRILLEDIQDPRLEMVTISGVRINRDLTVAEILYTHASDPDKKEEAQKGLDSAKGRLRRQLGHSLDQKFVPELRFKWDDFLERMIYESP